MNAFKICFLLFMGGLFGSCSKTESEVIVSPKKPVIVIKPTGPKTFDVHGFIPYKGYIKGEATVKTNYQGLETYLQTIGVQRVNLVYENRLIDFPTGNQKEGVVSVEKITAIATAALNEPCTLVSLDIEGWDRFSAATPAKYSEVMKIFRKTNSVSKVGFYAIAPQATFSWSENTATKYDNLNKTYAGVAAVIDHFSPTLYNFDGNDNELWRKSAVYHISQCRKYGFVDKPIIPYITPEVTDKVTKITTFLSYDEMTYRLQTLSDLGTNGCIIWVISQTRDVNGKPIIFDENTGWGKAIKDYIAGRK